MKLSHTTPHTQQPDRGWIYACVIVLIVWGIAASTWSLTGKVVPWDSKNHFYAMFRFIGNAFANGEWPLWNPYHFSGHPTSSDPQSLLFAPFVVLLAWLSPQASMSVFDVVIFVHLLIGAFGLIAFFVIKGWRWEGATLAALIFMLGGSASARLQHVGMILSYSFLPIALILLHNSLNKNKIIDKIFYAFCFGVVAGIMAIGRDQVAYLGCVFLIFYALSHIFLHVRSFETWYKTFIPLSVSAIIGLLILSIPMLLTLQLLKTSSRPAIHFGVATMGSLPPLSFLTLLWADVFGSLRTTFDDWGPSFSTLIEGTWTDRSIQYLFMGTAPVMLLVYGGLVRGWLTNRSIRFFTCAFIAALFYVLGWYTPVFEMMFDLIPGVSLYRRPADASFIINFLIAILAGFMFHRCIKTNTCTKAVISKAHLFLKVIAYVSIPIALLVAGALAYYPAALAQKQTALFYEWFKSLIIFATLISCMVLARAKYISASFAALLLIMITGAELISRNAASAMNAERIENYAVFDKNTQTSQKIGINILKQELNERNAKGEYPRVEILGLGGAWQNASMVLGIESTIGYNPLRLSQYQNYVGVAENAFDPLIRQFPRTFRGYSSRLASLLGIEYLVLNRPLEDLPEHFPRPQNTVLLFENADTQAPIWIYRLPASNPRAYFATQLLTFDPDNSTEEEGLPTFSPPLEALINLSDIPLLKNGNLVKEESEETNTAAPISAPATAPKQLMIKTKLLNSVSIDVQTAQAGVLVLHDLWFPGWEVKVNGVTKPLLRMNMLFRGVELEAGNQQVIFSFKPFSWLNLKSAFQDLMAPATAVSPSQNTAQ